MDVIKDFEYSIMTPNSFIIYQQYIQNSAIAFSLNAMRVGIIPLFFSPGRNTFGITHFRHF
jgi:hypothetical protein